MGAFVYIIQAYITSHLQSADIGLILNIAPSFLLHAKLETFFFQPLSQFMSSKPDYQPGEFQWSFLHPKYWGRFGWYRLSHDIGDSPMGNSTPTGHPLR